MVRLAHLQFLSVVLVVVVRAVASASNVRWLIEQTIADRNVNSQSGFRQSDDAQAQLFGQLNRLIADPGDAWLELHNGQLFGNYSQSVRDICDQRFATARSVLGAADWHVKRLLDSDASRRDSADQLLRQMYEQLWQGQIRIADTVGRMLNRIPAISASLLTDTGRIRSEGGDRQRLQQAIGEHADQLNGLYVDTRGKITAEIALIDSAMWLTIDRSGNVWAKIN